MGNTILKVEIVWIVMNLLRGSCEILFCFTENPWNALKNMSTASIRKLNKQKDVAKSFSNITNFELFQRNWTSTERHCHNQWGINCKNQFNKWRKPNLVMVYVCRVRSSLNILRNLSMPLKKFLQRKRTHIADRKSRWLMMNGFKNILFEQFVEFVISELAA